MPNKNLNITQNFVSALSYIMHLSYYYFKKNHFIDMLWLSAVPDSVLLWKAFKYSVTLNRLSLCRLSCRAALCGSSRGPSGAWTRTMKRTAKKMTILMKKRNLYNRTICKINKNLWKTGNYYSAVNFCDLQILLIEYEIIEQTNLATP